MEKVEIRKRRREIQELVNKYRGELEAELYDLCEENGGHEYWDWQDTSYVTVGGDFVKCFTRMCTHCRKKEYRDD